MANPKKATVAVELSVSPSLSLSDPDAELDLRLGLRVAESARPDVPITILVYHNAFDIIEPGDGLDTFARGAFTPLKNVDSPEGARKIRLGGHLRVNERMAGDALDLRERGLKFVTIPSASSSESVTFTHRLSWDRMFKYAQGAAGSPSSKDDLTPGERFQTGVNRKCLSTAWWCFGDLEGELKGKKFHAWRIDSGQDSDRPSDDFVRDGGWVLGESGHDLGFQIGREDGVFEIVQ